MEDEIPPEWMWPFDDELKEWFDEVEAMRKNPDGADNRTEVPMTQNEWSRE